jgi:alkanesulfonate monooxygenase SsuD/methylene tetrahydromethanopterin reductase-like flavin-dependent oxidoreductase (luciferase family)
MPELGFALSSEDHEPRELVRQAALAEQSGFTFCTISDHYHPWIDKQGHSGFVWSTLGGIAQATSSIHVWTGVTCPTIRIHPAIVAQAAASVATKMPGRFALGVGSGENLNEHAASQSNAARLAGQIGDGMISTSPDEELLKAFEDAGGNGKPKLGMIHVAYDKDAEMVDREDLAPTTPHGPDPEPYLALIRRYGEAGLHPRLRAPDRLEPGRVRRLRGTGADSERVTDGSRTMSTQAAKDRDA